MELSSFLGSDAALLVLSGLGLLATGLAIAFQAARHPGAAAGRRAARPHRTLRGIPSAEPG